MSHFNEIANVWDTPDKISMYQIFADKIYEQIPKSSPLNILEIGCGTGLLGSHFVNGNNRLTGVDTSKGMLEVFDKKFKGNSNVCSHLLNLEEQALSNEKFDLIISSMAFHHLKDPAKLILKLKNMLTEDGVIAVIDLDKENGTFHPDNAGMGVLHFGFSDSTTQEWSTEAGFSKYHRENIFVMKKESGDFPIFLALFSN